MMSYDGPWMVDIRMISYDQATRECQPFLYGGCRGNANRFETQDECRNACVNGTSGLTTLPAPAPPRRPGGGFMLGGGGAGVPGGHSPLAVNKEVKMVAAKGQNLLATSATITGSECSHAQLLGVIKAESQVRSGDQRYKYRNKNTKQQT